MDRKLKEQDKSKYFAFENVNGLCLCFPDGGWAKKTEFQKLQFMETINL